MKEFTPQEINKRDIFPKKAGRPKKGEVKEIWEVSLILKKVKKFLTRGNFYGTEPKNSGIVAMSPIIPSGPVGNIVCGGEGDGIFRRGGGTDSKFEWPRGDQVRRERQKDNLQ